VERRLDEPRAGDVVDSSGRRLGRHAGVHRFTVGQRKGLGVAAGVPLYVLGIDAADARVILGPREELGCTALSATSVNWIAGNRPPGPLRITARIRHRHRDAPALVTPDGAARAVVLFDEPQLAVTPGQAVVFYDGDEVVGGGWIGDEQLRT
jgi:tRNA-specific 2-thiouridylase